MGIDQRQQVLHVRLLLDIVHEMNPSTASSLGLTVMAHERCRRAFMQGEASLLRGTFEQAKRALLACDVDGAAGDVHAGALFTSSARGCSPCACLGSHHVDARDTLKSDGTSSEVPARVRRFMAHGTVDDA